MERIPMDWLMEIPPVTRTYMIGVVGVSLMDFAGLVNKSDCYYTGDAVFKKGQWYRLVSSFLYFGTFSFDLVFTLFVVTRYSKALEQSFAKTRDFVWFMFVVGTLLVVYATFAGNMYMLGSYLNDTLIYIWSRRNPEVQMTILGLINFRSIYLPIVSVFLSRLVENNFKLDWKSELAGILVGQIFVFFNDMYPKLHSCESPLRPFWYWFRKREEEPQEQVVPDVVPVQFPDHIIAEQAPPQQQQVEQHVEPIDDIAPAGDAQPQEMGEQDLRQRQPF